MRYPRPRLARPLYESLPWLYMGGGLAALALSYREIWPRLGVVLGLGGTAALLAGSVVWLRRRGYRRMRTHYAQPDALSDAEREPRE
jgi:hypothetical protein